LVEGAQQTPSCPHKSSKYDEQGIPPPEKAPYE